MVPCFSNFDCFFEEQVALVEGKMIVVLGYYFKEVDIG